MSQISKFGTMSQFAKHATVVKCILYTIFVDAKGSVAQIPIPSVHSITVNYYINPFHKEFYRTRESDDETRK